MRICLDYKGYETAKYKRKYDKLLTPSELLGRDDYLKILDESHEALLGFQARLRKNRIPTDLITISSFTALFFFRKLLYAERLELLARNISDGEWNIVRSHRQSEILFRAMSRLVGFRIVRVVLSRLSGIVNYFLAMGIPAERFPNGVVLVTDAKSMSFNPDEIFRGKPYFLLKNILKNNNLSYQKNFTCINYLPVPIDLNECYFRFLEVSEASLKSASRYFAAVHLSSAYKEFRHDLLRMFLDYFSARDMIQNVCPRLKSSSVYFISSRMMAKERAVVAGLKGLDLIHYKLSHGSYFPSENRTLRKEWAIHAKTMVGEGSSGVIVAETLGQLDWYRALGFKNVEFVRNSFLFKEFPRRFASSRSRPAVIHAGTVKDFNSLRPLAYECFDEYLCSIRAFVSVAAQLPEFDFIVKARSDSVINESAIRREIKLCPNVVIYDEGKVSDMFCNCFVVVGYSSTAMEEALLQGISVIQYVGRHGISWMQDGFYDQSDGESAEILTACNETELLHDIDYLWRKYCD